MDPLGRTLALALLFSGGCVSVSWERESRYAPVPREVIERLEVGPTDLAGCLDALGAPLWVWEHGTGGEPSAVLAYGWFDEKDRGVRVSVPVSEQASVSLDYDQIDRRMKGLVLFFDAGWKLTGLRTGLLRDLSREARRRPAFTEDGEELDEPPARAEDA